MEDRILLLDGNNLAWRATTALKVPIVTQEAVDVTGAWNAVRMFAKLIEEWRPKAVFVIWDGEPTHKLKYLPTYKLARQQAFSKNQEHYMANIRDRVFASVPYVKALCEIIGFINIERATAEGDDLIAAFVLEKVMGDMQPVIISSDRDYLHLANKAMIVFPRGKYEVAVTKDNYEDGLLALYAVPEDVTFPWEAHLLFHSLMGDKSDDVPGCPKMGVRTSARAVKKAYEILGKKGIRDLEAVKNVLLRIKTTGSRKLDPEEEFRVLEFNWWFLNPETWVEYYARDALLSLNFCLNEIARGAFFEFCEEVGLQTPMVYYHTFEQQNIRSLETLGAILA